MTITTKRFLLRDFTKDDASAFVAYHADTRSLAHYGPEEAVPGHAERLLQTFAFWASERPRRNFQLAVVRLKEAAGFDWLLRAAPGGPRRSPR